MAIKTLDYEDGVKLTIDDKKNYILMYSENGEASSHVFGKNIEIISMLITLFTSTFVDAKMAILKKTLLATLIYALKEQNEDVRIIYKGEEIKI